MNVFISIFIVNNSYLHTSLRRLENVSHVILKWSLIEVWLVAKVPEFVKLGLALFQNEAPKI